MNEIDLKLQRVRNWLKSNQLDGVLFHTQAFFAWITGGLDAHIPIATDAAGAGILVTRKKAYLLTNSIEAPRLMNEEKVGKPFRPLLFPWFEPGQGKDRLASLFRRGKIVSDNGAHGTLNRGSDLTCLRWTLVPDEIKRYRKVGRLAARILEETAPRVRPGMTEFEIAGMLGQAILSEGALPHLILVASDERVSQYRHPIPTAKKLRRHLMMVTGVKQGGLIANVTRMVHFGKLSSELRRKHDAVCYVDAALNLATQPGRTARDLFALAQRAYKRVGFPGEWKFHHQGGATGYIGREWTIHPNSNEVVQDQQAVAWNPSIAGTKSEDTILCHEGRIEILTAASRRWPKVKIHHDQGVFERADILVRK